MNNNGKIKMKRLITDNEQLVKYQVLVNGAVMAERESQQLAETFVTQLTTEQQNNATIITVTSGGKQVLFG